MDPIVKVPNAEYSTSTGGRQLEHHAYISKIVVELLAFPVTRRFYTERTVYKIMDFHPQQPRLLGELISIGWQEIDQRRKLLTGVKKEMRKLETTFRAIQAVLVDAEEKQVSNKEVKVWLEELKGVAYDVDDILDEWKTIIGMKVRRNVPSRLFHGFKSVVARREIGHGIQEIRERLDVIAIEKDKFNFNMGDRRIHQEEADDTQCRLTSSMVDISEISGRTRDKDVLVSKLLSNSSNEQDRDAIQPFLVVSIVGMGGIGKTTLAQLVFNDKDVRNNFEKTMWVCVSDPFDKIRVAKAIIEEAEGLVPTDIEWQPLHRHLRRSVKDKQFLLVLDDVWTEKPTIWNELKVSLKDAAQGSRIIMTTRNERVAIMMDSSYIHHLGGLSTAECWSLFSQRAFAGRTEEERQNLGEIGMELTRKCKGVPLAAKTLGGLMRFKRTKQDWQYVLQSHTWVEEGVLPALLLSYYDLPIQCKWCFAYCAIYPKDYRMNKDKLIKLWMANGFLSSTEDDELEVRGEECFDNLVMRSFFHDIEVTASSETYCKMHDIIHDFAQFLAKNECSSLEFTVSSTTMELSRTSARHLCITLLDDFSTNEVVIKKIFPRYASSTQTLRTLQLDLQWHQHNTIFSESLHLFRKLRALDMSRNGHEVRLSNEVGKLLHLRLLDLSGTKLQKLPASVSTLYNLQTLNLNGCNRLKRLPRAIKKLKNLRHLEIEKTYSLVDMPEGIGRLRSLRTLSKFIVGNAGNKQSAKIKELKDLDQLRGNLEIRNLKGVASAQEAREAQLTNKQYLTDLKLNFQNFDEDWYIENYDDKWLDNMGEKEIRRMETILEVLQPHSNLELLSILNYPGSSFPSWMDGDMMSINLPCLRTLTLDSLPNLKASQHQSFPNTLRVLHVSNCPEFNWTLLRLPPHLELNIDANAGMRSLDSSSSSDSSDPWIYSR